MDYLITEAVAIKVNRQEAEAQKEAEEEAKRKAWKEEQTQRLKQMFPATGR